MACVRNSAGPATQLETLQSHTALCSLACRLHRAPPTSPKCRSLGHPAHMPSPSGIITPYLWLERDKKWNKILYYFLPDQVRLQPWFVSLALLGLESTPWRLHSQKYFPIKLEIWHLPKPIWFAYSNLSPAHLPSTTQHTTPEEEKADAVQVNNTLSKERNNSRGRKAELCRLNLLLKKKNS